MTNGGGHHDEKGKKKAGPKKTKPKTAKKKLMTSGLPKKKADVAR